MRKLSTPRRIVAAATAVLTGISLAGCGSGSSADDNQETFVFGSSTLPTTLDGAYIYDNESQRVIFQIFDRLVNVEPGTTKVTGELATEWEVSEDRLQYTFHLREGVKFHDGTDLNAEAVCFNFDRLYNLGGPAQDLAQYWQISFRGFATDADGNPGDSRYKSCEAPDEQTVVLNLTEAYTPLVPSLANIGFGIASPTALEKYGWSVELSGDSVDYVGTFGTQHPVGSGPFKFESWEPGKKMTLVKNEDYWGEAADIETLIYVPIDDAQAKRQALENGEIDGYDNVAPQDVAALKNAGFNIAERPPSNVGYLLMNQGVAPLNDARVRQAIAHALNIDVMLKASFLDGAIKATQFLPPNFMGFNEDVASPEYDPEEARSLIQGAPNKNLELWYPTGVSRPYMPDPKAIVQTFKADLEKVGFSVKLIGRPWTPDYSEARRSGKATMHIIGLLPDMPDPAQFFNLFTETQRWGQLPESLLANIAEAEEAPAEVREALYEALSQEVMENVPGIPFVHAPTHLAFREGVTGFVPSPLFAESMAMVEID